MKEIKAATAIGTVVGSLLFLTINLFLPSGLSFYTFFNSNLETMISNLPTLLFIAMVCEILGTVIGFVVSKIAGIIEI